MKNFFITTVGKTNISSGHIFKSSLPHIVIPDVTTGDYVFQKCSSDPALKDTTAIVDGDNGDTLTYSEIESGAASVAGGLLRLGADTSSVIALIAPNCPAYPMAYHAVLRLGATVTTINPGYTVTELSNHFIDCQPSVVFTVKASLETVLSAGNATAVKHVIVIDTDNNKKQVKRDSNIQVHNLGDVQSAPLQQQDVDVHTHTAALPYSSGTSGTPKGVMLSHRNLVANLMQCRSSLEFHRGETVLAVIPFFHIYGMQLLMNCMLAEGVKIITMRRFDIEKALQLIEKYSITRLNCVPPMIHALANHPAVKKYNTSSLCRISCGAAPLASEVAKKASDRIGCTIVQGFGMTEMSPVSHMTLDNNFKPGSCGTQLSNTECKIINPDGNSLGVDEEGELLIRGPQIMQGYLNQPIETARCLDKDGWLHTGDVARIDDDGHLYIVDRLKELIKYKGFQVAPAELESIIITHPSVSDAAVIGIPDIESGEKPKAFVKLKQGHKATAQNITRYVATRVSAYKNIRALEFVNEIPKTPSGKILRRQLRSQS